MGLEIIGFQTLFYLNMPNQPKIQDIDTFFRQLPENEYQIAHALRQLILDTLPNVQEHFAYNVPYYKIYKNLCFIWPAAILWGKKPTYEGVRLGFTKGYLLQDEQHYLDKGNRKQVYWRDYTSIEQIDISLLKTYLLEAVIIDKETHQNNANKKH